MPPSCSLANRLTHTVSNCPTLRLAPFGALSLFGHWLLRFVCGVAGSPLQVGMGSRDGGDVRVSANARRCVRLRISTFALAC
jgi:hypothetical protein